MKKGYQNKAICKKCGGMCCLQYPGAYSPEDFPEFNELTLLILMAKGEISVDWWEGDPREEKNYYDRGYFLRPKVDGGSPQFDPTWGGRGCIYLMTDGCKLKFEKRPYQCRILKPNPLMAKDNPPDRCECEQIYSKRDAAIEWLPYYDLFEKLRNGELYENNVITKVS